MRWLLICLAIAGCARAGKQNSIIGGLDDAGVRGDGDSGVARDGSPDGPLIDAPPGQVTLTQAASDAVAVGASKLGCRGMRSGITAENSYYRVFTLSDYGVATTLHVAQVAFGIDTAIAGTGPDQPATVRIGTYGGTPGATTLDLTQVRTIDSVDIAIPNGGGTRMTVPITGDIAASANLIVELFIPDGSMTGNQFLIGVNTGGERAPGYLRGPDCGIVDPTTYLSIAQDNNLDEMDMILSVTGMTDPPS